MSILLSKRISIIRGYSILLAGGAVFFFLSVLGLSGCEILFPATVYAGAGYFFLLFFVSITVLVLLLPFITFSLVLDRSCLVTIVSVFGLLIHKRFAPRNSHFIIRTRISSMGGGTYTSIIWKDARDSHFLLTDFESVLFKIDCSDLEFSCIILEEETKDEGNQIDDDNVHC